MALSFEEALIAAKQERANLSLQFSDALIRAKEEAGMIDPVPQGPGAGERVVRRGISSIPLGLLSSARNASENMFGGNEDLFRRITGHESVVKGNVLDPMVAAAEDVHSAFVNPEAGTGERVAGAIADTAGHMAGALPAFVATGAASAPLKAVPYVGDSLAAAMQFGTAMGVTSPEEEQARAAIEGAILGPIFHGAGRISSGLERMGTQGLIGYGGARLAGAEPEEALGQGVTFGALGAMKQKHPDQIARDALAARLRANRERGLISRPEGDVPAPYGPDYVVGPEGVTRRPWQDLPPDPQRLLEGPERKQLPYEPEQRYFVDENGNVVPESQWVPPPRQLGWSGETPEQVRGEWSSDARLFEAGDQAQEGALAQSAEARKRYGEWVARQMREAEWENTFARAPETEVIPQSPAMIPLRPPRRPPLVSPDVPPPPPPDVPPIPRASEVAPPPPVGVKRTRQQKPPEAASDLDPETMARQEQLQKDAEYLASPEGESNLERARQEMLRILEARYEEQLKSRNRQQRTQAQYTKKDLEDARANKLEGIGKRQQELMALQMRDAVSVPDNINTNPTPPAEAQTATVDAPKPAAKQPWEMTKAEVSKKYSYGEMYHSIDDYRKGGEPLIYKEGDELFDFDRRTIRKISAQEADAFNRVNADPYNASPADLDVMGATNYSEPMGAEKTYFRYGELPESLRSYNTREGKAEAGVSVYLTPNSGSLATAGRSDVYYGRGRQVGWGGDDEPVVIPIGEWKKWPGHKKLVKQALSEGKPVPPEVLADYPDLAPKPAEAPAKPEAQGAEATPAQKASEALGKAKQAWGDLQKQGIRYDPRSTAEAQLRVVRHTAEYLYHKAVETGRRVAQVAADLVREMGESARGMIRAAQREAQGMMRGRGGSMARPASISQRGAISSTPRTNPTGEPINPTAEPSKSFAPPKKTVTAYKLFRTLKTHPGKLFPLFIGNTKEVPVGEWIPAEYLPTKGYAKRPGWHAGVLPDAPHLMRKDGTMPPDRVWAEVELPADKDWQAEADLSRGKGIVDRVPENGHYKFKTNKMQGGTWIIGGALRIKRVLSHLDVRSILDSQKQSSMARPASEGQRGAIGLRRRQQAQMSPAERHIEEHIDRTGGSKERYTLGKLITDTVDDLFPLKKLEQSIFGTRKGADKVTESLYKQARLFKGWAGLADVFLNHGTRDAKGNQTGDSLRKILQPVEDSGGLDAFERYLVAHRSIELRGRDVETGIDPVRARQAIQDIEARNPHFARAKAELKKYQDALVDYMVESGVLSQDAADAMRVLNRQYIPFYRAMEGKQSGTGPVDRLVDVFNPVKRIHGSDKKIVSPLESVVKNTYAFLQLGRKAQIGEIIADYAGKPAAQGIITKVRTPVTGRTYGVDQVSAALRRLGIEVDDTMGVAQDFVTLFGAKGMLPEKGAVSVLRGGKREFYQVPPDVWTALEGLNKEQTNIVMKVLSQPASLLRLGATLTPEFALGRNPFRDTISSFVYSEYGALPGINFARGMWSAFHKDSGYWDWKASGGEHAAFVSLDRTSIRKNLRDVIRTGKLEKVGNIVRHPIETLRIISEFTENANRLGEFKLGMKKELAKGTAPEEARARSAFASKEVSQDFTMMGAKIRAVNQISAFLGARVGGYTKIWNAFNEHPARSSAKALAAITLPSISLMLMNRDDPRWEEIPQWQKDLFWIVMTDEHIYRFPKPFELGIVFGSIPERIVEGIVSKDPTMAKKILKSVSQIDMPIPEITALNPLIQNYANRDWTGKPLVGRWQENIEPELQYGRHTSETAKILGKWANYPPAKIDNLISGYMGGLGKHAVGMVDAGLKATGAVKTPTKPSTVLADIPFGRGFVIRNPSESNEIIQKFYESRREADKASNTVKTHLKAGRRDDAVAYIQKHQPQLAVRKRLDKIANDLADKRKKVDAIYRSDSMSAEEKRVKVDMLVRQMTRMAKAGNTLVERMEKIQKGRP